MTPDQVARFTAAFEGLAAELRKIPGPAMGWHASTRSPTWPCAALNAMGRP
jgi:hypothetical protein